MGIVYFCIFILHDPSFHVYHVDNIITLIRFTSLHPSLRKDLPHFASEFGCWLRILEKLD